MKNFDEIKDEIISKLRERTPILDCPVCHNKNMILIDGYLNCPIQKELKELIIGGPSIPTIGIICSNCGHLMEFSLGALGLLPPKEQGKGKD